MSLALLIVTLRRIRRGGGRPDLSPYLTFPVITTFLRQSHLMLEVDLLGLLSLAPPHTCYVGVQVLPLPKVLTAVSTGVALTVHLRHMFPQLRFLLEMYWFRSSALITCEPPFMSPLNMLPLLVSVGESLQTPVALGIGALE